MSTFNCVCSFDLVSRYLVRLTVFYNFKEADERNVVAEEQRRIKERNERTLFIHGFKREHVHDSDLKSLHPDIVSIRRPYKKK